MFSKKQIIAVQNVVLKKMIKRLWEFNKLRIARIKMHFSSMHSVQNSKVKHLNANSNFINLKYIFFIYLNQFVKLGAVF